MLIIKNGKLTFQPYFIQETTFLVAKKWKSKRSLLLYIEFNLKYDHCISAGKSKMLEKINDQMIAVDRVSKCVLTICYTFH